MKKKFILIIPARLKSTRLPSKPLKLINGKPLIYWTWKNCSKVVPKDQIYVATDSDEIHEVCKKNLINSIDTSDKHLTGTDRISEASKKLQTNLIINVQGDEPFIKSKDLAKFINFACKNNNIVTNACTRLINLSDHNNINIPKVVISQKNDLLYMSRAPIPGYKKKPNLIKVYKQVCMYGFPKKILIKYFGLNKNKTPLEKIEDIEILRVIENDINVKILEVGDNKLAIDTPADLIKAKKMFK